METFGLAVVAGIVSWFSAPPYIYDKSCKDGKEDGGDVAHVVELELLPLAELLFHWAWNWYGVGAVDVGGVVYVAVLVDEFPFVLEYGVALGIDECGVANINGVVDFDEMVFGFGLDDLDGDVLNRLTRIEFQNTDSDDGYFDDALYFVSHRPVFFYDSLSKYLLASQARRFTSPGSFCPLEYTQREN